MAQLNVRKLPKRTETMIEALVTETGYTKVQIAVLAIESFFWKSFGEDLGVDLLNRTDDERLFSERSGLWKKLADK